MALKIDLGKMQMREAAYFMTPALDAVAVTPNDSTEINPCRALYIGSGGHIKGVMSGDFAGGGGETVVFQSVASGTIIPISVKKVMDTSTNASNIVALY